ncbi:hypothetical protein ACFJIX_19955 [Roseateles sp. UC29_93]|uniref:hypothetical protein n=1 Tax=Roseateles sp. UC29_93 TaxID=3350177 RepID=UPI00366EE862
MVPAVRVGRAFRAAIAVALMLTGVAAEASSNAWPAPPRPVGSVGLAPRGMLFAPSTATAGGVVAEEGSDEQFRAQAEAEVLRRLGVAARRDDLRLWLPVVKGRPVVLDSQRSDPADPALPSVDFRLDGLSPDGQFYVVRATLPAGSELLWISRADGTRYEMHGNVNPSPDGRFLVVTHASPGQEFNGVVLWSRRGRPPRRALPLPAHAGADRDQLPLHALARRGHRRAGAVRRSRCDDLRPRHAQFHRAAVPQGRALDPAQRQRPTLRSMKR